MTPEQIARIAHEANRGYCLSTGDTSVLPWDEAGDEQRASILAGVKLHTEKPEATPEQSHEQWMADKLAAGWKHGEKKDAKKKTHPCLLPYAELPAEQKAKDWIFRAVVHAALAVPAPEPVTIEKPVEKVVEKIVEKLVTVETTRIVGKTAVKYIGHRARYGDGICGSGLFWSQGETLMVLDEFAVKLLRYTDVWVEGDPAEATDAPAPTKPSDDEEAQADHVRMEIAAMDKDALESFAKTRFQLDIDKRHSVEALRMEVIGMVDRFGAP